MIQALAFALTLAVELPTAALWRFLAKGETPLLRLLGVAALGTLLTHPIVWALVADWLRPWPYWGRVAVAECFAVAVEALVYWRLAPMAASTAAGLSVLVNTASFAVGYFGREWIFAAARALH